jgi:homoserine dehydrogenase
VSAVTSVSRQDTIRIGFLGLGVVGSGAYALIERNRGSIEHKIGSRIVVSRIAVRDLAKRRAVTVPREILTNNPIEVVDDPDVDIVCELIGGVSPAREYVLRALRAGKHVVSANKELIAKHGAEIIELADSRRLDFAYEGSVAGGIPIIQPLRSALAGNSIIEVKGIVNGTTNYILTRMTREGAEFGDVLREAQALGYAEADPTSDVDGYDAQYKLAILASLAFTTQVRVSDVYVEGISHVTARDIDCARDLGYVIKLLAIAARSGENDIQARVHPALVPAGHPLASTNDVYNAILARGDAVGDVMFFGRGAGMMPTGSAVVGDIIDICRNIQAGATGRIPSACFSRRNVLPMDTVRTKYYVRMLVRDTPGVLAAVASVFGEHRVSIETVVQKATREDQAEIVWVTHEVLEADMRAALGRIRELPVVDSLENWLRVEN